MLVPVPRNRGELVGYLASMEEKCMEHTKVTNTGWRQCTVYKIQVMNKTTVTSESIKSFHGNDGSLNSDGDFSCAGVSLDNNEVFTTAFPWLSIRVVQLLIRDSVIAFSASGFRR